VRAYLLIRPIVAFSPAERKTLTIPAGTVIRLLVTAELVGVARIEFEGRSVMIQRHDIQANALSLPTTE